MYQLSLPYWRLVRRPVCGKALGVAKSLNSALDAEMMLEREERRIVERAQREVDHVAVRIIERQRRAARAAEATPRDTGGGVIIRLPSRPAHIRPRTVHQAGKDMSPPPPAPPPPPTQ